MIFEDPDTIATMMAALATIVLIAFAYYCSNSNTNSNSNNTNNVAKPKASNAGIMQTIRNISGSNAPFFLLDTAKNLDAMIFKLNLPLPGGAYVVGSAKDQRTILLDRHVEKPVSFAASIDQITGGSTVGTRERKDPRWKHVRKGLAPAFSSSEVSRMNIICKRHADQWMLQVLEPIANQEKSASTNQPSSSFSFDPSAEMLKISLGSIIEAGFEYHCTAQEIDFFTDNLNLALQEYTFKQMTNPLRRPFGIFIAEVREAKQCVQNIRDFTRRLLMAYRNKPQEQRSTNNTLIKLLENNSNNLTDQEKLSEMCIFLIAGHDTTAYSLASVMILLANHPKEMEKVKESLHDVKEDKHGIMKPSEYLSWVIMESRRLIPVSAISPLRRLERDFEFHDRSFTSSSPEKGTFLIPKGATVFLPQIVSHLDPVVFDEPEQFRPARWADASKEMISGVVAFGIGIRKCIGQSLAVAELESILPALLSKYEFEIEEPGKLDFFMTLKYTGTKLRVKKYAI